ncbi:MAG: hypothetical protein P8M22_00290 [Phycisphaerales bacterium]|nr:hypothetical protein [Phycisphaerales bacterium]
MILLAHDSVSDLLSFGGGSDLSKEGPDRLLLPLGEFTMPWFLAALILGYVFAIVLSAVIAWHPRSLSASSAERLLGRERVLLLLGLIGATVAEIVMAEPAMALVIFGIGGLIRFRTRLPDEELNFKGILVVIIGLACGMSELALAVFVTIIGWLLIWFIDKSQPFRIRITCDTPELKQHLRDKSDEFVEDIQKTKLRVVNAAFDEKKRLVLYVSVPVSIDEHQLREIIRERIATDLQEVRIRINPL